MASMIATATVPSASYASASRAPSLRPRLQVLCCRPSGVKDDELATLDADVAAQVDVERCSPQEAGRRLRTWISATQPSLILLRDGGIVAMAVGVLSRLDVERLIRHALL
jgi:hypothetical protein